MVCLAAVAPTGWAAKKKVADVAVYAQRAEVREFAADVAQRRGLDPAWLQAQLAQARLQPTAQRLMMPAPAGTAKNWAAYRDRFIEPQRIEAGVAFWQDNADTLAARRTALRRAGATSSSASSASRPSTAA